MVVSSGGVSLGIWSARVHHLPGHGVVDTIVAVLDVLVSEVPCGGHFMPVRALSPPLALALDEEAAHRGAIPLQYGTVSFGCTMTGTGPDLKHLLLGRPGSCQKVAESRCVGALSSRGIC